MRRRQREPAAGGVQRGCPTLTPTLQCWRVGQGIRVLCWRQEMLVGVPERGLPPEPGCRPLGRRRVDPSSAPDLGVSRHLLWEYIASPHCDPSPVASHTVTALAFPRPLSLPLSPPEPLGEEARSRCHAQNPVKVSWLDGTENVPPAQFCMPSPRLPPSWSRAPDAAPSPRGPA